MILKALTLAPKVLAPVLIVGVLPLFLIYTVVITTAVTSIGQVCLDPADAEPDSPAPSTTLIAVEETDTTASTTSPTSAPDPTASCGPDQVAIPSGIVTSADIVRVRGFQVHADIAPNLARLLSHADREGISLTGWGWRSHQRQIELRRAHCGTSDYAIWHMPSSRCSPPTARPGRSMHESGLAVDFRCNGRALNTRANPCFVFLHRHAASYGFYNLPSEPWHWSINGR